MSRRQRPGGERNQHSERRSDEGKAVPPKSPGDERDSTDSRPPVFLSDQAALAGDRVVLDGPEGRHAATVRRLGPGERVDLTDGAGLVEIGRAHV